MGSTTIQIQGFNPSGGGGGNGGGSSSGSSDSQSNKPPQSSGIGGGGVSNDNNTSMLPSNERMIEDIRREMRQRGVMLVPGSQSMHKIIDEYAQNQRKIANTKIEEKYNEIGERENYDLEEKLKERIIQRKQKDLSELNASGLKVTPDKIDYINNNIEKALLPTWRRELENESDKKNEELRVKEEAERTQVEKELAERIKTLSSFFEREAESGVASRSYLGQLKEERKQYIEERDSATTEEDAINAQKKLNEVNEKISNVINPNKNGKGNEFDSLMVAQGLGNMFSSLQNGDIAGSAMGGATALTGILGLSKGMSRKLLGWVGLAVGATKGVMDSLRANDDYGQIASILGGVGSGYDPISIRENLLNEYNGLSYTDMGMSGKEFSQLAVNYLSSLGVVDSKWQEGTLSLAATETEYGLSRGQLNKLAKYGRYKRTSNGYSLKVPAEAFAALWGNFEGYGEDGNTNSQTVLDAYSSVMQSYMSRTENPDFYQAYKTMYTLSGRSNNSSHFDERTAGEIATVQGMIQNPANDRMQALIYGTVGDLYGINSLADIDKKIIDPKNETQIMKAVIGKINDLYGGIDTEMGYFAYKQLLPNMAPDRRRNLVNSILNGKTTDESSFWGTGSNNVQYAIGTAEQYTSDITSAMVSIKENIATILTKLIAFFDSNE